MSTTNLPLSGARLWDSLMELAKIGGTPNGGCNRQTLTDLDSEGRHLLRRWGEAIGCTLSVDRLGNMVLRREGRDPKRKPVAMGSHLDTQPTGGKFDGPLGVLAGLEVLRALHEAGIETEAPLVLINWTNEAGARFSPPMMGSGGAMGIFPEADVLALRDSDGKAFGDELTRIGWRGDADPAGLADLAAYFELHIEQGALLENASKDIGVVTHALAQAWYEVTIEGAESHGGSPMAGRRDAMMAAAPLIAAIEDIALRAFSPSGEPGRATVGRLTVYPDSRNIAPSRIWFSIDTRHGDPALLARMGAEIRAKAAEISAARGVTITIADFWQSPLTPLAPARLLASQASSTRAACGCQTQPTCTCQCPSSR
ncbi:MAG: Zn-dependent hydrolase [Alphaproteobacteria bacterium]